MITSDSNFDCDISGPVFRKITSVVNNEINDQLIIVCWLIGSDTVNELIDIPFVYDNLCHLIFALNWSVESPLKLFFLSLRDRKIVSINVLRFQITLAIDLYY